MAVDKQAVSLAIYNDNAPFFQGAVRFVSEHADYGCLFCSSTVVPANFSKDIPATHPTVACAYDVTGNRRVAHVDCLRKIPGANLSTDSAAYKKARLAADKRRQVLRAQKGAETAKQAAVQATQEVQQASTPAPTVDETALRAAIAEQVAADYKSTMQKAIALITDYRAQIAALTEERDLLQLTVADLTAAVDKKAQRRAKLAKAS